VAGGGAPNKFAIILGYDLEFFKNNPKYVPLKSVMPRHVSGSRCCEFTQFGGLRERAEEGIVLLAFRQ
jgi:hypothetical protein